MSSRYGTLAALAAPACVLAAAYLLTPHVGRLPVTLDGLRVHGPYVALAAGFIISLTFRRGRLSFALLGLLVAYASYRTFLARGTADPAPAAVYAGLCLFVPLYLGALALLRERGIFNIHGTRIAAAALLLAAVTAWAARWGGEPVLRLVYTPLVDTALFKGSPIPQSGLAAMALGLVTSLVAWLVRRSPVDLGLAGALLAFAAAVHGIAVPNLFAVFITAGALICTIAALQDTFRMAFRDELTGLPSRRALNEHLAGLGRHYTIAMLDVDHFKSFNDTYGHDVGDQVLKMVAARIARVGGGGSAYRYGGEEFTVLFPRKRVPHALPHLETLRQEIAGHQMKVRGSDRPAQAKSGKKQRGSGQHGKTVAVTISIGVAEKNERSPIPEAVIKAADKALYRAKRGGRNRVSR